LKIFRELNGCSHGHTSQNLSHTFEPEHKKLDDHGRPQRRSSTASTIRQRHDISHSPYITLEKKSNGGRIDENTIEGGDKVLKIVDDELEFSVEDEASCSTSLTMVDYLTSNESGEDFEETESDLSIRIPPFSKSSNLPLEKSQSVGSPTASVDQLSYFGNYLLDPFNALLRYQYSNPDISQTEEVHVAIPPEDIPLPKPAGSRTESDTPGQRPIVDENSEKRIRKLKGP
jgi:hypothetical protein